MAQFSVKTPQFNNGDDSNSPSYMDVTITNVSAADSILNGLFDGFCLNPNDIIEQGTSRAAFVRDGSDSSFYAAAGVGEPAGPTSLQVEKVNWVLWQFYADSTSDFYNKNTDFYLPGADDYVFAATQLAIWDILGFKQTDAEIEQFWKDFSNETYSDAARDALTGKANAIISAVNIADSYDVPDSFQTALIDPDEGSADPGSPVADKQAIIIVLSSLGDRVWSDTDADGQQDDGEIGIAGATVNLLDGDGNAVLDSNGVAVTTTTDAFGNYQFTGLPPGDYRVQFVTPDDFTEASPSNEGGDATDSDSIGGTSDVVTLATGEYNPTIDAGFYNLASLGDYVWVDTNDDGIQNDGPTGLNGVTVNLKDGTGAVIATTTTANDAGGASGYYLFEGLAPGNYSVEFALPAGYAFAKRDEGDDTLDSDADPVSGMTQEVTLASGDNNLTLDAGLVELPASLGDQVFVDNNGNGVFDAGDDAKEGVTVNLFVCNPDGSKGAAAGTTTTDADGNYLFTGLASGQYLVEFVLPDGFAFTTQSSFDADVNNNDSDADEVTGLTGCIDLGPGETELDVDAGLVELPASLGDQVFVDNNGNGVFDAGDDAKEGVTVNLFVCNPDGSKGAAAGTTTTDADGNYLFTGLASGQYLVEFVLPDGFAFTTQSSFDADVNNNDSDADEVTGLTGCIDLGPGETELDVDAGLVELPASLGDQVFVDNNGNGVFDAGDDAKEGVTVNLFVCNPDGSKGAAAGTTTTDADGNYLFTGLASGQYLVEFVLPDGFAFTTQSSFDADVNNNDSDADEVTGLTGCIDLGPGETELDVDAGLVELPASLGDQVFVDNNGNGVFDAGDDAKEGVTVNLFVCNPDGSKGAAAGTTSTDADGNYLFTGLASGQYLVEFVLPDGFAFTTQSSFDADVNNNDSDADEVTGLTGCIDLGPGETELDVDAGLVELPASLGDQVFVDNNGNGVFDAGDDAKEGVTVNLFVCNPDGSKGAAAGTTSTDADGNYLFTGLASGQYLVEFVLPDGFAFTTQSSFDADVNNNDSDADEVTGLTGCIDLGPGETELDVDAGLVELPASLGDQVFVDNNGNGVFDAGDDAKEGVTVNLFVCNPDGSKGAAAGTTSTDADGNYLFTGLASGQYLVEFVLPDGFAFTTQSSFDADVNNNDSDADEVTGLTGCIDLGPGETELDVDAGLVELPASLGDQVFVDNNGNGVFDAGDDAKEGVTVNLFVCNPDGSKGAAAGTTTTDADGNYLFTGLASGQYLVEFVLPDGFAFTTQSSFDADVNNNDSDADEVTGLTGCIDLGPGETELDVDAGLVELPASLGDQVFVDNNGNGVFDAGDDAKEGVTVNLFVCNPDGSKGAAAGTTTTDADGNYLFTGLASGQYLVEFVLPDGFAFTTQSSFDADVNNNDSDADEVTGLTGCIDLGPGETELDVDAGLVELPASLGDQVFVDNNGNGVFDAGDDAKEGVTVNLFVCNPDGSKGAAAGTTTTDADGNYLFTGLASGQYLVEFVLPDGFAFTTQSSFDADVNNNDSDADEVTGLTGCIDLGPGETELDVDAGLVELPASLGDQVFVDNNGNGVFDAGDDAKEGVTVNLFVCNPDGSKGAAAGTTTTDADGNYLFTGLASGQYLVEFVLPDGFAFTTQSSFDADVNNNDSDADEVTGLTGCIDLGPGETELDVDAGLVELPASLGDQVFVDNNGNGVFDAGDDAKEGVTVNLFVCNPDGSKGAAAGTTTTDADGNYLFTGLASGQYLVEFVLPDGFAFTTQSSFDADVNNNDSDADEVTGLTGCIDLGPGETELDVDAGLVANNPAFEVEKFVRVDDNPISLVKFVGIQDPGNGNEGQFLCKLPDGTTNKAESMVFRYNPSTVFDTLQLSDGATGDNGKGGYDRSNNSLDNDSNIFIVVSDVEGATNASEALGGDVYFSGNVAEGAEFTANAVGGSFNNNTYFYFFDEEGGPLLQSAYYHMSCSAPIRLGDGILSAELIGYDGDASDLISLEPAEPVFFDANDAPGAAVDIGSEVLFRYEVTNTGAEAISHVVLTDDRLDNVTFVEGDADGDGNLDSDETWIYEASEIASEGLVTNVGIVTGLANGQTTVAFDVANYTGTDVPDGSSGTLGELLCQTEGKADAILFKYTPGTTLDTEQSSDKAEIHIDNGVDDDGTSFIVVTDENDAAKALNGDGKSYFRGNVDVGENFLADESTDSFGSTTYIHFYDSESGGLLQTVEYHTSCSQPIRLGDVIGNATLVGYDGEDDADSTLTVLPEPTVPGDPGPAPDIDALVANALAQVDAVFDPGNIGVDGDTAPGAIANIGDIVTFTYQVTNTGNVDLTLDKLTDDNATAGDLGDDFTPTFVEGDLNTDGILNVGETWYYQAREIADNPGLNTNIVKGIATGNGQEIMDDDPANYLINPLSVEKLVAVEQVGGMLGQAVCETEGKAIEMVFEYDPSVLFNTQQDPGKGAAIVNGSLVDGSIDDDGVSYIVITEDNDPTDGISGDVYFAGNVAEGEQFTASRANAGGSGFSSNTYFYFFDQEGGPLLQSANYHTSCSAPILMGDGILSATLIGYLGEDSASMVSLPRPEFVDADTAFMAPEAIIGTEVTYQIRVSNDGDAGLTGVSVTDPGLALTLVDDGNGDDVLDGGETWIYQGSKEAVEGLQTNVATAVASLMDVELVDTDAANYLGVKLPAPSGDLTELFDKPTAMAFVYLGGEPVIDAGGKDKDGDGFGDQDGDAEIEVDGFDADGSSFIVVAKTDKRDDLSKDIDEGDQVYFAGTVAQGQAFLADIDFRAEDKFENDTRIWVFDDEQSFLDGDDELQLVKFKTDGSEPLQYNDQFGSFQLVEYEGKSGMGYDDPEIEFGYETFGASEPWDDAFSPGEEDAFDAQFIEQMG